MLSWFPRPIKRYRRDRIRAMAHAREGALFGRMQINRNQDTTAVEQEIIVQGSLKNSPQFWLRNTSEKTEQFCQIFGSAPQDKASRQDIQRDH